MKFGNMALRQVKKLCEKHKECPECPIQAYCEQIFGSQIPCGNISTYDIP